MAEPRTPWHNAPWFTAQGGMDTAEDKGLNFASSLDIHDVTRRDGEELAGVELTAVERVRVAQALAETGVHRIEVRLPVSAEDEQAVRRIAPLGPSSEIYASSRRMLDGVKRVLDCGVSGVVVEISSSRHRRSRRSARSDSRSSRRSLAK